MKLAVIRVVGAMSMSEDRVTGIVEIAIKRFQECVGEAWTYMVGLEKGGQSVAEKSVFHSGLAGGATAEVGLRFGVKLA
jgi:hypothetical protein